MIDFDFVSARNKIKTIAPFAFSGVGIFRLDLSHNECINGRFPEPRSTRMMNSDVIPATPVEFPDMFSSKCPATDR